mmetsp:Transcript_7661/g.15272  ORF Transcript_7661/g.15272 Transcript_7661/m.15272 type:complete len:206 (+) Transcript_7661:135-752(+)
MTARPSTPLATFPQPSPTTTLTHVKTLPTSTSTADAACLIVLRPSREGRTKGTVRSLLPKEGGRDTPKPGPTAPGGPAPTPPPPPPTTTRPGEDNGPPTTEEVGSRFSLSALGTALLLGTGGAQYGVWLVPSSARVGSLRSTTSLPRTRVSPESWGGPRLRPRHMRGRREDIRPGPWGEDRYDVSFSAFMSLSQRRRQRVLHAPE